MVKRPKETEMTEAQPRYKDLEIEGKQYRVDFDGRYVEVSLVAEAPFKTRVDGMERSNAIWAAGKSLSSSKWWKEAHKQAEHDRIIE